MLATNEIFICATVQQFVLAAMASCVPNNNNSNALVVVMPDVKMSAVAFSSIVAKLFIAFGNATVDQMSTSIMNLL